VPIVLLSIHIASWLYFRTFIWFVQYLFFKQALTTKGVEFVSKKEAIDTTTPTGKFMLTIFGAVAELEREYILQRQREGIAIAKEQGKYTGRKPKESPDFDRVVSQWQRGEITAVGAMRTLKMSKTTFYRRVGKDKRNISLE
ncbi:MAG: recombinase family protein, partial [Anaerotruncus sp.]|nr:recombinase family protein [Anaerotruncus sp.]